MEPLGPFAEQIYSALRVKPDRETVLLLCLRVGMCYRNLYLDIAGAPASRRKSDFSETFKCFPALPINLSHQWRSKTVCCSYHYCSYPSPRRSDERGSSTLCYGQPCIQLRGNHNHGEHGSRRDHREFSGPVHEPARVLL